MKFKKLLSVGLMMVSTMAFISQPSYALFGKSDNKLIQLKGSDTILSLSQAVAEDYMKTHKGAKISVTGGGSGTGIAAKLNKTVDIAMASREMKDAEWDKAKSAGLDLQEVTIAYDGITIIVNKSNPVKNLTTEQLREIFMGTVKNWKEVGGPDEKIVVLSRDSSSGTHVYFKEHILRKGNEKGPEEYSKEALFLPSNEALKSQVEKTKGAIAYIGMGYMENTVKEVINYIANEYKSRNKLEEIIENQDLKTAYYETKKIIKEILGEEFLELNNYIKIDISNILDLHSS